MTRYNQFRISENLVAEVTDHNVYLEHEDTQWCTVLSHEQFEELFEFYREVLPEVKRE